MYGRPAKITTVDKYQGQQNDYILLSLVRTNRVGHLRDARRLVVAMSRARLGLYVFCRKCLFENCPELAPVFSRLGTRPEKLNLVLDERFPTKRKTSEKATKAKVVEDVQDMMKLVELQNNDASNRKQWLV